MALEKKNVLGLKIKIPKVSSILALSNQLTTNGKNNFRMNYGLILDFLHVKIDGVALTTLAQFYDPPLRCFTFRDFQLAPTLEEFEKIVGLYLKDRRPYLGLEENLTLEAIAEALHLDNKEVKSRLETKGKTKGFSRKFLEDKAQDLLAIKNWKAFNAILALLVYGIVLFPNIDDFVDFPAIGVFLTKNPVPTLLADLYYSLHIRHGKKRGGVVSCCAPLLQIWLKSHLPKKGPFVEKQSELDWPQRMVALTEKEISWYTREYDDVEVILSCGEFPNVPLLGTRGSINYNPVLALRQLGYPMEDKPDESLLKGFILEEGVEDPALLRKIRRAWGQIHRRKAGRKNCIAKPLYTQWVKERVKEIKLPFVMITSVRPPSPEPITTITIEEADELKAKIAELQDQNEELQSKHLQAIRENVRLKIDLKDKEKSLQESTKRFDESEAKRRKIGEGLDRKLALEAQKKWRLKYEKQVQKVQDLDKWCKERLQPESIQSQEFENLYFQERTKCEHLKANIEAYEERCVQLQSSVEMYEEYFAQHNVAQLRDALEVTRTKLAQREAVLDIVWRDAIAWRNGFKKLATLSNLVIDELPEKLRDADAVMPCYNIPKEVVDFMEYCKDILKQYKEEIKNTKRRVSA
ncbi:hypothetical protein L195_g032830 [Trifolium pratense]|uniref:DUF7745 domain-containing protein n=1 Tax=Trifolium pratense TaxID=57577 RepID=A0A2K3LE99_TRIPR|nr:hypothetical protein L195_g032830 [Trifolium pratense]